MLTPEELRAHAEGARDAIECGTPGLIVIVVIAQPDPDASRFAAATNIADPDDVTKLLRAARIALVGS